MLLFFCLSPCGPTRLSVTNSSFFAYLVPCCFSFSLSFGLCRTAQSFCLTEYLVVVFVVVVVPFRGQPENPHVSYVILRCALARASSSSLSYGSRRRTVCSRGACFSRCLSAQTNALLAPDLRRRKEEASKLAATWNCRETSPIASRRYCRRVLVPIAPTFTYFSNARQSILWNYEMME